MSKQGYLIDFDWHSCPEGRDMLSCLLTRNKQRLRTFGLLERPPLAAHIEEVRYKIFLAGKTGVGKTATVAKLTGNDIPKSHAETAGIQTTTSYWPVKVLDRNTVMLCRLQFWDVGEAVLKKFDHTLQACLDKVDAILFLFSIVDKSSFDELHQLMSRLSSPTDNLAKIVVATKCDQHALSEVPQKEIRDFEKTWKIPVLKIRNIPDTTQNEARDTIYILNCICEQLWQRDLILAGKLPSPVTASDKSSNSTGHFEQDFV